MKAVKKNLAMTLAVTLALVMALATALPMVHAWLSNPRVFSADVSGSIRSSYFEDGDGSEEHPYIIARPIQLYYLAWLQDLGYFNQPITQSDGSVVISDGKVAVRQYHFEIVGDSTYADRDGTVTDGVFDMTGYTLPPIGTVEYPFVGSLNGNGNRVTNLTVSNSYSNCSNAAANGENMEGTEAIGFFGVIGSYGLEAGTLENTTVGENEYPFLYDAGKNEVADLVLQNLNVNSEAAGAGSTLIGLAAGYVNGAVSGVAVADSGVTVAPSRNEVLAGMTNLSDYGLVGHCTDAYKSGLDVTTVSVTAPETTRNVITGDTLAGHGDSVGWGGSIDIRSLNMRLYNLMNAPNDVKTDDPANDHASLLPTTEYERTNGNGRFSTPYIYQHTALLAGKTVVSNDGKTEKGHHIYYKDDYNIVSIAARTSTHYNYFKDSPENTAITYSFEGAGSLNGSTSSFKPAANSTITIGSTYYKYFTTVPGTILPLLVGSKEKGYQTLSENTGYIVGGMSGGSGSYADQTTIRSASYRMGYIFESLNGTDKNSATYQSSNLEILTNSQVSYTSGTNGYKRICDNFNINNSSVSGTLEEYTKDTSITTSLKKYTSSRARLDTVLSGQSLIHGLHFTGASINKNSVTTIDTAYINNHVYGSGKYELPLNSIDFHLQEDGIINFFAGSYIASGTIDSFFSLNKVERSGDDITAIYEISKIYKNTGADKKDNPYVYLYTDGSYSNGNGNNTGDMVFDMEYLWHAPEQNTVYYFEIPVNSGEYAMGSHGGSSYGAYLLYLDIGTNGGEEGEGNVIRNTTAVQTTETEAAPTFANGVQLVASNGSYTNGADAANALSVSLQNPFSGSIQLTRTGNTVSITDGSGGAVSNFTPRYLGTAMTAVTNGSPGTDITAQFGLSKTRVIVREEIVDSYSSKTLKYLIVTVLENGVYTVNVYSVNTDTGAETLLTAFSYASTAATDAMTTRFLKMNTEAEGVDYDYWISFSATVTLNSVSVESGSKIRFGATDLDATSAKVTQDNLAVAATAGLATAYNKSAISETVITTFTFDPNATGGSPETSVVTSAEAGVTTYALTVQAPNAVTTGPTAKRGEAINGNAAVVVKFNGTTVSAEYDETATPVSIQQKS